MNKIKELTKCPKAIKKLGKMKDSDSYSVHKPIHIISSKALTKNLAGMVRSEFYVPNSLFKEFLKDVINIAYERKIFKTKYGCSGYILKEIEPKIFEAKRS